MAFDDIDSSHAISTFASFGELLRHLRRRTGMTQRELGQALSYTETHITRLEKGQRLPDLIAVKGRFVIALGLQHEPKLAQRLNELAKVARDKPIPQVGRRSDPTARLHKRTNLPTQLTSFVGHERELNDVKALLGETRLLTLIGAGGVGKTRLAEEVATGLRDTFPDGIWLVEMAALIEPSFVAPAVAEALLLTDQPGHPPVEVIADYLETKQVLLILDNCEHVLAACSELIVWLLQHCPRVRILVTSRETLRIPGEMVYRVPSLDVPPLACSLNEAVEYASVQLFMQRARWSRPDFALTASNTPAVVQLCRRLDGIPLALELAAAQITMLSVEQIASRLEQGFQLLIDGKRTPLPRHQTLHATLDWSYSLLTEAERDLLCVLSIFAGTFTLEAAENVSGNAPGNPAEAHEHSNLIFTLLTRLTEKSLIIPIQQDDEVRYRILDTIREYGREKLVRAGRANWVAEVHLRYAITLAEAAEARIYTPEQAHALKELDAEYDNLRAAMDWALAQGQAEYGLRLASALWPYWLARAYSTEGCDWLRRMLAMPQREGLAIRSQALFAFVALSMHTGVFTQTDQFANEALDGASISGDDLGIGFSYAAVGVTHVVKGDFVKAHAAFEESLMRFRSVGYQWGEVFVSLWFGFSLLMTHNIEQGVILLKRGLTLSNDLGDNIIRPWLINAFAYVAIQQREIAQAEKLFTQARQLWQALGDNGAISVQLNIVGYGLEMLGNYEHARSIYCEVLQLRREMRNKRYIVESLESFAGLAAAQGDFQRAVQLLGSAEMIRKSFKSNAPYASRAEQILAGIRSHMDAQALADAKARGQAMTQEEAIAYALAAG